MELTKYIWFEYKIYDNIMKRSLSDKPFYEKEKLNMRKNKKSQK